MNSKFTLLLFLLFPSYISMAQEPVEVPNIIPPSPTSAGLGKYGDIPTDLHRGTPNISIPLYEISSDDIRIPISLSFHASGHKVGEQASWVGLGWSLNAGGVVNRSMRGKPDEDGYFHNMSKILDWHGDGHLVNLWKTWVEEHYSPSAAIALTSAFNDFINGNMSYSDLVALGQTYSDLVAEPELPAIHFEIKDWMHQAYTQNFDTQADIFNYNFPGGSGKFMFKPDRSIIQIPHEDLLIEPTSISPSVPCQNCDGDISGFSVTDRSGIKYSFTASERTDVGYPTRAGLNDPNDYKSSWYLGSITSQRSNKTVNFVYSGEVSEPGDQMINQVEVETVHFNNASHQGTNAFTDFTSVTHFTRYIDSISWDGGSIKFVTQNGRFDKQAGVGRVLKEVIIRNNQGEVLKKYKLDYNPDTDIHATSTTPEENHLILHSITEVSKNDTEKPPYTFEYYDLNALPDRDSFSKDHDGYYNARANNTLVPTYYNYFLNNVIRADRSPQAGASKTGMLEKITYPTGGSTQFEYENHDYYDGLTQIQKSEVVFAEDCVNGVINPTLGIPGISCSNTSSKTITIPSDAYDVSFVVESFFDHSNPPTVNSSDYYVKIYQDGSTIYEWNSLSTDNNSTLLSPENTYTIEVSTNIDYTRLTYRLNYHYSTNNPNNELLGGIRVKKITDYLPGSVTAKVKEYSYEVFTGSNIGASSGLVLTNTSPNYLKQSKKYTDAFTPNTLHYTHGSSGTGNYEVFGGGQVVYTQVKETYPGNGYTQYQYVHAPDEYDVNLMELPISITSYPQSTNMSSTAWKRGLLKKQSVYSETGDLLNETENQYGFPVIDSTYSFKYDILFEDPFGELSLYTWSLDKQRSGWVRHLSSTTKSYEDGQELSTTTSTQYSIDNAFTLPVSRTHDLDGINDYSESFSYLNDRTNHIISPISSIVRYDDQNLALLEENYTYENGKLEQIDKYLNGKDSPDYTTYLSEYNGAKPSFIKDPSGINTVYLWAYGGTLPVAKIVNVNYETVQHSLGPNLNAIESSNDGNFIRTQLLALKGTLSEHQPMNIYLHSQGIGLIEEISPNGLITTYHYDDFNRLYQIKDQDNHVLKEFQYNYSN